MLIVITLPYIIPNEADAIIRLFDERGIDYLHLRKPGLSDDEVEPLLMAMPRHFLSRITIHDHVALAQKYGVGGIHLTSRSPEVPHGWQGRVSTSCHSIDELSRRKQEGYVLDGQQLHFDYLSLSPIFDSISKQGYQSAFTRQQLEEARCKGIIDSSVLALGGVTFERIAEVRTMGFGGAMILGDAWRGFGL